MTPEEYIALYEKYRDGVCTAAEEEILMKYRDNFRFLEEEPPGMPAADEETGSRIYSRIMQTTTKKKVIRSWWWAAAAMLLLFAGISSLLIRKVSKRQPIVNRTVPQVRETPIKPGTNTATLTLANGDVITLDDAADGVVARTGHSAITKQNGQLSYATNGKMGSLREPSVNTVSVPRGGQYTITLSDGTRVWLNSESSLSYAEVFNGKERKVILSGEAYFEVSKNEQQPFIVQTERAMVHVLGTDFNINAYKDEQKVKATLLKGSIRFSNAAATTLLSPGEQGIIDGARQGIDKKHVNVNQEVAWKSGYFVFRNNTIHDIMRQIGRWYDVEVEYRGDPPQGTFGGTYSKNKDIQELLKGLELTGLVHFQIEGRKIIVK
jgi:hypothetical protein